MLRTILIGCVLSLGAVSGALAAPIQWPISAGGNNHYYDFVSAPNIKWTDAKTAAEKLTFAGVHGYLATVTSAPESSFMATNFSAEAGPFQNGWLGGYQDTAAPDYSEPAGGWRWVSGEPWSYTNWFVSGPVEPDNLNGTQNYIRSNVDFRWDDFANDPSNPSLQFVSGYLVEYPVPEPVGWTIPALVGSLLMLRTRRGSLNSAW